jgi:ATP-dependent Zn protease
MVCFTCVVCLVNKNNGGFPAERPYSDATAQAMDEEAKRMVDVAYERTVEVKKTTCPVVD